MAPVIATKVDVSNVANNIIIDFTSFTFMPNITALSSPKSNTSNDLDIKKATTITTTNAINGNNSNIPFCTT